MKRVHRFRWIMLSVVASIGFVVFFHRVSSSVLVPDLIATFDVSGTRLGVLASAYFYSYALMQPVVGILADRWKPRAVIALSATLMGVGSLLFAIAPSFSFALVARVVVGLGAAGVFVPFVWLTSRWFEPGQRGFVFALWVVAGNTGAVVAAGPLGLLASTIGWREALLVLTALTLVLAIIGWLVIRNEPAKNTQRSDPIGGEPGRICTTHKRVSWLRVIRETFSSRAIVCGVITSFLSYGTLMAFQGLWGVPFFMDVYGYTRTSASALLMLLPIGVVIGGLSLARFFDSTFGRMIYVVLSTACTVIYLVFAFIPNRLNLSSLVVLVLLLGATRAGGPYLFRVYSNILPRHRFGTAMGLINAMPFFGGMLFQPLTGYLFDRFGMNVGIRPVLAYRVFFLILAIALIVATICGSRVREQ